MSTNMSLEVYSRVKRFLQPGRLHSNLVVCFLRYEKASATGVTEAGPSRIGASAISVSSDAAGAGVLCLPFDEKLENCRVCEFRGSSLT
jgi:hypothetical protein